MKVAARNWNYEDKTNAQNIIETNNRIIFYTNFILELVSIDRIEAASSLAHYYAGLIEKKLKSEELDDGYNKNLSMLGKQLSKLADENILKINPVYTRRIFNRLKPQIIVENQKLVETYDL